MKKEMTLFAPEELKVFFKKILLFFLGKTNLPNKLKHKNQTIK